ncbi:unnamed protein product [Oreochromis niloticus]|nr:unnamed protein product [Mustela putorius furo]
MSQSSHGKNQQAYADHQNLEPNSEETHFQLPLKRKQGPDYVEQNCRSAHSCFPPRKKRRICEEKTVLKRQYSQILKGSKNNSESYSPERKRMRIVTEKKETAVTPSIQKSWTPRSSQPQVEKMDVTTSSDTKTSENTLKYNKRPEQAAVTQRIQKSWTPRSSQPQVEKMDVTTSSDTKTSENTLKYNKRPEQAAVTQRIQKSWTPRSIHLLVQKMNDMTLSDTKTSENTLKKKERPEDQRETNVWIIGSSYIRRAEIKEIFGENLGLNAKVQWFGKRGMQWRGVLPRFYEELSTQSPPDILVIHAGGDDLGLSSAYKLSSVIEKELIQLHTEFPSMTIAYSSINERQVWRYGNPGKIDKDRKIVNASIRMTVDRFNGVIIEHPHIRFFNNSIFLPDGVHFTKKGSELFLTSIRTAIQKSLQSRH